jgi:hypothetical protein
VKIRSRVNDRVAFANSTLAWCLFLDSGMKTFWPLIYNDSEEMILFYELFNAFNYPERISQIFMVKMSIFPNLVRSKLPLNRGSVKSAYELVTTFLGVRHTSLSPRASDHHLRFGSPTSQKYFGHSRSRWWHCRNMQPAEVCDSAPHTSIDFHVWPDLVREALHSRRGCQTWELKQ